MFKKGDIVVRTNNTYRPKTNFIETNNGFIFKCLKNARRAYYRQTSGCQENNVRKATEDEIKWFEAGITNINQIPEVGSTFDFVDETDPSQNTINETITSITNKSITCNNDGYDWSDYVDWYQRGYIKNYKPPIKSKSKTWNEAVPIDTPFEPGDLKNCKIGYLTPEDHEIIQPFLFSLGYKWSSGAHLTKIDQPYLCTTGDNYIFKKSNRYGYNQLQRIEIKKETILNYIKQLNTNKNEVHRQNQEITRRTINGRARILSGRQQGSTGSRPKGNIQSIKGRETYFRRSEICGSVRLG